MLTFPEDLWREKQKDVFNQLDLDNVEDEILYDEIMKDENQLDIDKERFIRILTTAVVGPGEMVRDTLRKFLYLGPLREMPSRSHEPALSPDESRWATGIAAWDTLYKKDDKFVDQVNEWLAIKTGSIPVTGLRSNGIKRST